MPTTPGPTPAMGNAMAATCPPKLLVLETYAVDSELIVARLVQVFQSREPRVLNTAFDDITHARALLQAVTFLVDYSLRKNESIRVIVPDQTVVALLHGRERPRGRQLGQTIADIRCKVDAGAQVTFEHGTLRTVLGEAAEHIDLW